MDSRHRGYITGIRWGAGGVVGCGIVVAAALGIGAWSQPAPSGIAPPASFLADIPVEGKTPEEVKKLAQSYAARIAGLPLGIRHNKYLEKTTPLKLGARVEIERALTALFETEAPSENLLDRIRERFTGPDERRIPLEVTLPEEGVAKGLRRFSIRIGADPRDARMTTVGGKLTAIPPKPGKELDPAAVTAQIRALLDDTALREKVAESLDAESNTKTWLASVPRMEVQAVLRTSKPRITLEDLKPITSRLTGYSTSLGGSSRNRIHNVQLACKAIDGTVLLPGDEFSYNDIVGPRVPSAGYKEAPVIVRGKLQPGTGGGICQVSSTLYNAALMADMQIVRRRHHSFPVKYVPVGRDATVVDGVIDFRFKNRFNHPVAIDAKVVGSRCVVLIHGHPADDFEINLLSSRISRIPAGYKTVNDPRLPKGRRVVEEPAKDGRRVTVSRVVKKDGQVIRQEVVTRDYYRPQSGVVRVGTAEPKKPDPTPETEPTTLSPEPATAGTD